MKKKQLRISLIIGLLSIIIIQSCTKEKVVTIPVLYTDYVSELSYNYAIASGGIISTGNGSISEAGFCWSLNANPTIADSKVTCTITNGMLSGTLSNLLPSTTYYYCSYATNSAGTGYGAIEMITTEDEPGPTPPIVTSVEATNILDVEALLGGNVTDDGGAPVTARGICWGENSYPTLDDNVTVETSGEGTFSSTIDGLTALTTYYFRAYATNSEGTSYGENLTFTTLDEIFDPTVAIIFNPNVTYGSVSDNDGHTYKTVVIGTQTWMAENLKTRKLNNGTAIPKVTIGAAWFGLMTPGYCYYDNDEASYAANFGAIYNWYAVNTGKLCPTGWHVPTNTEWNTLITYLGGMQIAGDKLKEIDTEHWRSPNDGATNETGFTALGGGYRVNSGYFYDSGNTGNWWTATIESGNYAYKTQMFKQYASVYTDFSYMVEGNSVRCLKD